MQTRVPPVGLSIADIQALHGGSLIGTWVQRRVWPVRVSPAASEMLIGLIIDDGRPEVLIPSRAPGGVAALGISTHTDASGEGLYYVEWESAEGEWVSTAQLADLLMPVSPLTGLPVVVRCEHDRDSLDDQYAMVVGGTALRYQLRLVAMPVQGEQGVVSRKIVTRNRYITKHHDVERFVHFNVRAIEVKIAPRSFGLFGRADAQTAVSPWVIRGGT